MTVLIIDSYTSFKGIFSVYASRKSDGQFTSSVVTWLARMPDTSIKWSKNLRFKADNATGKFSIYFKKRSNSTGKIIIKILSESGLTSGYIDNSSYWNITSKNLPENIEDNTNTTLAQDVVMEDTLVKQNLKSDTAAFNILMTSSSSPTSGEAAEAGYSSNLTWNPSSQILDLAASTSNATIKTSNGTLKIDSGSTLYINSATGTSMIFTQGGADTNHELTRFSSTGNFIISTTAFAPTPAAGNSSTQIATTEFVSNAIGQGFAANDAMIFKGTLGNDGTTTVLPTSGYSAGWTYRVATAGVYAGEYCEVGDLIIAVNDGPASGNTTIIADWTKVQNNIEGIVYRSASNVAVGSTAQPIYSDSSGQLNPISSISASYLPVATTNQAGIVSTTDQWFGGNKFFNDNVVLRNGGNTIHTSTGRSIKFLNDNNTSYIGQIIETNFGSMAIQAEQNIFLWANYNVNGGTATVNTGTSYGIIISGDGTQAYLSPYITKKASLGSSANKWNKLYVNLVNATSFSGSGANITNLNAFNLSSGTVPFARLPDIYWADIAATSAASYKTSPEFAVIKLNGDTAAAAASSKNVTLQYDSSLEVLNFVFA